MFVIPRERYEPSSDVCEGDLVTISWSDDDDIGIVLKVAIVVRNEDHLTLSEEVLIAEVYVNGKVFVFDEDEYDGVIELTAAEKNDAKDLKAAKTNYNIAKKLINQEGKKYRFFTIPLIKSSIKGISF